jgi:hypothetical protein
LSIKEDCFDNDIGNSSKAPAYDLKGLKFEPARQDLEELMAFKENLFDLSAIISQNWSTNAEEAAISGFILFPKQSAVAYKSWI